MERRLEQGILLAIAVVSAAAFLGLEPATGGLMLAGLHLALAICVGFR